MATVKEELQEILKDRPDWWDFDVYVQVVYIDEDWNTHKGGEYGPWGLRDICDDSADESIFYYDSYDVEINLEYGTIEVIVDDYRLFDKHERIMNCEEPDKCWW
ncbi:hypothetical protein [Anaerosporobacter sp.]